MKDLSAGVSNWVSYEVREDEATQSPSETFDFVLDHVGKAYSSSPRRPAVWVLERGSYLDIFSQHKFYFAFFSSSFTDSCKITFNPTNGTVGGFGLIAVAVVRDIRLAV